MQKDAFKPQGREISVMGVGNPLMPSAAPRRAVQMPQAPTMGRQQAPAQPPAPQMPSVGRGAPVSDRSGAFKPMGAPVQLAGSAPPLDGGPVDRSANFQPSDPSQVMPAPQQQELAAAPQRLAQAPRPFLQRQVAGETVFRVTMRGRTADGAEYASVYDAVMPPGTEPIALDFAPLT